MDADGDGENDTEVRQRKRRNPFHLQQVKEERERRQKKRARLIVRNISFKATEETLRQHFEQWGKLEDLNLLKRADGKMVGCAFVQYETINQATKAILKGNNQPLLGRNVFVDWALGKDEFRAKKSEVAPAKKAKLETSKEVVDLESDEDTKLDVSVEELKEEMKTENGNKNGNANNEEDDNGKDDGDEKNSDDAESDSEQSEADSEEDVKPDTDAADSDDDDKKDVKSKLDIEPAEKKSVKSNDVKEGCTIFIKNVPFDATDDDLRKLCRKYGPVYYAIINRQTISGHSKGTAFVKFKKKESADLCLQSGTEFALMDQAMEPLPAMSREEIKKEKEGTKDEGKDSRNLYLVREGLIMAGSHAAEGVSASDMSKRLKLERIKTQVLKNLSRFVSRNRLSIHNLPLGYDDEKLKQMAVAFTGLRPHECRVMRENKITMEHPKGKSKGFGFLSFSTHQEALTALRKLNNNPKVFGTQHRPIVAFSIEDRAVYKLKENRERKSKLNNPTYKDKLEQRKAQRAEKVKNKPKPPQQDSKKKVTQYIQKLNAMRESADATKQKKRVEPELKEFAGATAKPGTALRLRSNKKINEQAKDHMKRIKTEKRKQKQQRIRQTHLAERRAVDRPKQGRKVERDDISQLVKKYKKMIGLAANEGGVGNQVNPSAKKPKRTKWYTD